MLTKKELLILFFISSEPGIRDIYTLFKIFDKADFPANISKNIVELLKSNLIIVFENFENGTAKNYEITEKGKVVLKNYFIDSEIIEFVKEMPEPNFITELTENYIIKKNNLKI